MKKSEIYLLFLIIIASAVLRFSSLGYSHFYGDETKTLFIDKTISASDFLFSQRKGPVQFLVVWVVEKLTGGFNEFYVRLPFAIAGFLSVGVFYVLIKKLFGWREALFATALFGLSGFNIAFSRTAQYQSILILTGLLAVLFMYQYSLIAKSKYINLLLSSILLGISFLTHYDAVFFAIPCAYIFYRNQRETKFKFKDLITFMLPLLFLVSLFYVPYVFQGNFANNTYNYLSRRATGNNYLPSNSIYTAKVYNPNLIGFIPLFFSFFFLIRANNWKKVFVFLWFVVPFVLFEYLFQNPGTHINNYYIPLYICAALGFVQMVDLLNSSFLRKLMILGIGLIFIVYGVINGIVYVPDFNYGYPWQPGLVDKGYHLYLYGFPYYRAWDQIKTYLYAKNGVRNYYTNDNTTIAAYYLYKFDLTPPGTKYLPQYFINVTNNQEFRTPDTGFLDNYTLEKEFYDDSGKLLSQVYKLTLESL